MATFPGAEVVAIEPERENFALLQKNCDSFASIHPVEAAIGSVPGRMHLIDPGEGSGGFRMAEGDGYEVDVITMPQILDRFPPERYSPFICKIDIEGGEKLLFRENTEWMQQFPLIIIELHDWLLTGEANSHYFLKEISALDIDLVPRLENLYVFNNTLLKGNGAP